MKTLPEALALLIGYAKGEIEHNEQHPSPGSQHANWLLHAKISAWKEIAILMAIKSETIEHLTDRNVIW